MIYYNASGETKEIDDAVYAQWVAAGNPKASAWNLRPNPPAYDPATHSAAWDGAQWVVSALPPPPVPTSVPAYFFRRSLRDFNKRSLYKAYVTGLTDENVKDYWETAVTIQRNSRYMPAMRTALGITPSKLDDIFIVAGVMDDD